MNENELNTFNESVNAKDTLVSVMENEKEKSKYLLDETEIAVVITYCALRLKNPFNTIKSEGGLYLPEKVTCLKKTHRRNGRVW